MHTSPPPKIAGIASDWISVGRLKKIRKCDYTVQTRNSIPFQTLSWLKKACTHLGKVLWLLRIFQNVVSSPIHVEWATIVHFGKNFRNKGSPPWFWEILMSHNFFPKWVHAIIRFFIRFNFSRGIELFIIRANWNLERMITFYQKLEWKSLKWFILTSNPTRLRQCPIQEVFQVLQMQSFV